ncbi:retrotransposon protein, putative, ty1-copia subclass [Tanacetum coccineum]
MIEKKTPMEMWSGHPRYPEGVKGYRLYRLDDESPKIVTSRNVVFNETVMYKDMLKDSGAVEEEDTHKPLTCQEAVSCEDSSKWKAAMKEYMDSLSVQNPRYKARLVARGFTQRAGIDYNEVFSSVVRYTSIRVIHALTACKDYKLEQLDVKMAFLYGNLEEVIYMRSFDEYMLSNRFKRSSYDSCVYYRSYAPGEYIYLLLYVDDMLIACKSKDEIGSTKSLLKKEFGMKELGEEKKILGMEIVRDQSRKILRVSQSGYVSKMGGHFKSSLKDCPVRDCYVERMSKVPYENAVGSLMYLMVCTRPDIVYAVSIVSRYLASPDHDNHVHVTSFVDSDYAKDPDKEAEYMALTEAVKEAIWLRGLLEELGVKLNTVAVNCDNQGAIH